MQKIFFFPYKKQISQLEEQLAKLVEDGYRVVQFQVIPHTILGDHNVVHTEYSMLVVAEPPIEFVQSRIVDRMENFYSPVLVVFGDS